jgi:antitoxin component YwqK of YwqJK toxin-antitoxin module
MSIETRIEFYRCGNIKNEFSYLNGVQHGPQKHFDTKSKLNAEYFLKNNLRYGIYKYFHINETFQFIDQNKNNQAHGVSIEFKY